MEEVFIGEAEGWDPEPKHGSLQMVKYIRQGDKEDMTIETKRHDIRFFFKNNCKILGYLFGCRFDSTDKSRVSLEERLQKIHRTWYRDVKVYRSKDAA